MKSKSLSNYLILLQTKGRYTFTKEEALAALDNTLTAFRFAALRLIKKKQLIRPVQGFYVIVPTEYQAVGAPPTAWFIDSLMKFYQQPYYIGLLSAAALHGAAHQQPQIMQVVTAKPLRPIIVGHSRIAFFTKKYITPSSYQHIRTPTGYMAVSTPEVTALDLIRYAKSSGHLNHVATVLTELQERFEIQHFSTILNDEKLEAPDIQRLGYLLEQMDTKPDILAMLKQWVAVHKPRAIPLRSDKPYEKTLLDIAWRLYINERIEADI